MKSEVNRIAIGSVDIYMVAVSSNSTSFGEDSEIEIAQNFIGRTKDGGEVIYNTNYFSVKSDDGLAGRSEMTDDSAQISFGLITWNGSTLEKLLPTALVDLAQDGKTRTTRIGGVGNANSQLYLIRAVHRDKEKGDVRYTMLGRNINGFAASYKPGQATTLSPSIEAEPFDDGRLLIMNEVIIPGSNSITITGTNNVAVDSTVTLTATTVPAERPSTSPVVWRSSDVTKATVSQGGVVTGVEAGAVSIIAFFVLDGVKYTATFNMTVTAASE